MLLNKTTAITTRSTFSLLGAAVAILLASANAQGPDRTCTAADHYKITTLPFRPARINNSGVIAGTTEDHQAATWSARQGVREIELPAGFTAAEATGINQPGVVVGFATKAPSGQFVAFRFSGEKFSLLSDEKSKASAIDDSDDVAGESANHLVLWLHGNPLPLGECCGGNVRGINHAGQVVGQVNDRNGHYHAFLWDVRRGLRSLTPPQGTMSTALAINTAGHVLVQAFTPNVIYFWERGKFTPVQLSNQVANQPLALNDCDVIVGEFGAASDFYRAFIWDRQHGFRDLNQSIAAADNWRLESALDINDRGEIIGVGDHGNQGDVGFLLTPEPQTVNHRGH